MPVESFAAALESAATKHPGKLFCAFSASGEQLGYGELQQQVERCESLLRDAGFGPGMRVAICLPPSGELLIHLLAVMQSGGLAVPFDVSQHPGMTESKMQVLDPHLVVRPAERAGKTGSQSPAANADWQVRPSARPQGRASEARLGIFTSGSTGTAKCVLLSSANLLAGAAFVARAHHITAMDRALCLMPLSHINGLVTTVLAPLLTGSSVVFFQHTVSARNFLQVVEQSGITWFSAAPMHYQLLLYAGRKPREPSTCRFGRSASAPLPVEVLERFEALYGIPIVETMGLSECAGQVFSNPMTPGERRIGAVGRPVGNAAGIVDANGRSLPDGKVGEIRVKGPNVMLGYLGETTATAEVLRDGWLYTGDLGFRDRDGFFHVTGRKKLIAIVGGINVSLLAVEALACSLDFVDEAAALARPDRGFGEIIDLFYVGGQKAGDEEQRIRHAVDPALPNRLALGRVRRVTALPRSASGKLLRHQLAQ